MPLGSLNFATSEMGEAGARAGSMGEVVVQEIPLVMLSTLLMSLESLDALGVLELRHVRDGGGGGEGVVHGRGGGAGDPLGHVVRPPDVLGVLGCPWSP
jgi:hypothetical protein